MRARGDAALEASHGSARRRRAQREVTTSIGIVFVVVFAVAAATAFARARKDASPAPPARAGDVAARLDAFWAWWRSAAPRLAAEFDAGRAASVVEELGARVHAIDPRLAWETGPGLHAARHHLALSADGDMQLRVLAERWVSRAPAPDAAWEYYPARQATPNDPKVALTFHDAPDARIDYQAVRVAFETDAVREIVHVTFHHPALGRLPEEARARAAFLVLDGVLGEDGVERWLGRIRASVEPLADGRPLDALASAVATLARTATGERYATMEGRTASGRPVIVMANLALKRVDHLLMDHHLEVGVPFRDEADKGLPTGAENEAANALEHELVDALGHDAVWIGHETGDGRRTIHLHVSEHGPAEARAREWAERHRDRGVSIDLRHDPGWDVLRKWG